VFKDETSSRYSNGVPELGTADFETVITLMQRNGGDLAIGWIRDRSNKPLAHCHFNEPPIPSAQPPVKRGNVFARQQEVRKYVQVLREDAIHVSEWRHGNQQSLENCRAVLAGALKWHSDALRTDIAGALRRATLAFGEPQDSWILPPQRYLVMVTDGFGNVGGPIPEQFSNTKMLVVNSAGTLGTLQSFHPIRFEDAASAFRFLVTDSAVLTQTDGGK
jgi:hypothetical protein